MSKKISELPAAPNYTLTDYLPIVDAETDATQKLYISQLATASFGLSASFLSLDTSTGALPTTGLIRIPYSNGYVNVMSWQQGGNFSLLRTDAAAASWLLGSLGGAYGNVYGYTLNLDGWSSLTVSNQSATAFTVTPSEGTKFATQVTASLGLSASFLQIGAAPVATSGLIRLPYGVSVDQIVVGNGAGINVSLLNTDSSISRAYVGSTGWYSTYSGYDVTVNSQNGPLSLQYAGVTKIALNSSNAVFSTPITASLGVSASVVTVGSRVNSVPNDAVLYVSGTQAVAQGNATRKVAVFGGDVYVSGTLYVTGLTGSLGTTINTYNSRPAAGNAGARYVTTDGSKEFVDDGSNWRPLIGGRLGTQPPLSSTFTAINAGGRATYSIDSAGAIYMSASNLTTADDLRILKKSAPAAPYTLTVHMTPMFQGVNYSGGGLLFRESSTGTIQIFAVHMYSSYLAFLVRYETASNTGASPTFTTGGDLITIGTPAFIQNGVWLKIADDNVNRTFSWSSDGVNFIQLGSVGRTSTMTANEVGIFVGNINGAGAATYAAATFDSFLLG